MRIAIQNQSTRVSDAELSTMCAAVELQANRDFCPAWGLLSKVVLLAVGKGQPWPAGTDATGVLIDQDAQEPDALGYHSETDDKPDLVILCAPVLDNGGVALCDARNPQNPSVASVLSHEVCELLGDPCVNRYADGPQLAQGSSYAVEVADPVESTSYAFEVTGQQVAVSDFVLPAWFDAESTVGPWSHCGSAPGPFKLAKGGYFVVRSAPGSEQQVQGEAAPPRWKMAMKVANPASRLRKCIA